MSIAPEAGSYAGIQTEDGPIGGYSEVTYQSCPSPQGGFVRWVGGFTVNAPHLVALVRAGATFKDGQHVKDKPEETPTTEVT